MRNLNLKRFLIVLVFLSSCSTIQTVKRNQADIDRINQLETVVVEAYRVLEESKAMISSSTVSDDKLTTTDKEVVKRIELTQGKLLDSLVTPKEEATVLEVKEIPKKSRFLTPLIVCIAIVIICLMCYFAIRKFKVF